MYRPYLKSSCMLPPPVKVISLVSIWCQFQKAVQRELMRGNRSWELSVCSISRCDTVSWASCQALGSAVFPVHASRPSVLFARCWFFSHQLWIILFFSGFGHWEAVLAEVLSTADHVKSWPRGLEGVPTLTLSFSFFAALHELQ